MTLLARAAAEDLGRPLALLRVDGGLTRSRVLMQTQADLLQLPVEVASSPHATAAGRGGPGPARSRRRTGRSTRRSIRLTRTSATSPPSPLPRQRSDWRDFERAVARLADTSTTRSRDRRPHLRRGDHRCRGRRHSYRTPAGALPAAHGDARSRRRCRHGNLEGQHRHSAYRVRRSPGKPRIRAGPARSRVADRLRRGARASPSRRPGPSWLPGTRSRRHGWTTWWRSPRRTGTSAPTGSRSRSCTGVNRLSDRVPRGPS